MKGDNFDAITNSQDQTVDAVSATPRKDWWAKRKQLRQSPTKEAKPHKDRT